MAVVNRLPLGGNSAPRPFEFHRRGVVGAQAPLDHVEGVGAEIRHLPARVIENEAEAVQAAVDVIRGRGGRTEPRFVIEPLGHGHGLPAGAGSFGVVGRQEGQHPLDLAEPPVAHQLGRAADGGLERQWLPICKIRWYSRTALTMAWPWATVSDSGFSQ